MTTSKFGLSEEVISKLQKVFAQDQRVEKVVVYGSRANGRFRPASDIDLSVYGPLDLTGLLKIENQIDDLLLPYKVDLSLFKDIDHADLIHHIQNVGQIFYQK